MHLLSTASTTLDDIVEPVDLAQPPGDVTILSFADSDLIGLAAAWQAERDHLPSIRLAQLRDLRHPMSVDLWIDRVASKAKVIVVRLLGGLDWWRYGVDRLSALARERGIALAVLPGEDRDDPRLTEASTMSAPELAALLSYFREAVATTFARCCAGLPAVPEQRFRSRSPAPCRAPGRMRRADEFSASMRRSQACRAPGPSFRSSSIGRCCSRRMSHRSMRCVPR
jgi:cobalamin biosynthesis Mg chelatase CobN